MMIPSPTIPFERVDEDVVSGKTFWAMRGEPGRRSRVEVYFVSMHDDGEERYPGVDYVGGYWSDESGGEEDWMELDEATEVFNLRELLWHEAAGRFEAGLNPEGTVMALMGP